MNSIGGVLVEMSVNDLYTAMQRGTVDATVLAFSSVTPYSVHEVATNLRGNASFGTSASLFTMNLDHFDGLPEDHRKAIRNAAGKPNCRTRG